MCIGDEIILVLEKEKGVVFWFTLDQGMTWGRVYWLVIDLMFYVLEVDEVFVGRKETIHGIFELILVETCWKWMKFLVGVECGVDEVSKWYKLHELYKEFDRLKWQKLCVRYCY